MGLDRAAITSELLDELTLWSARDRTFAFKHWVAGSFSLVHLHVLTLLEVNGPMAMSRLAEALDVSVASATGIVDRMEQRELVTRRHDIEDRRVVLVEKTAAGDGVFLALAQHRRLAIGRTLEELKDTELEALLVGLRAMRAARAAITAREAAAERPATEATR